VKLPKSKNVIKLKSADDTVPSGSRVSAGEPVSSPLAAIIAPPPPAAKKAAASAPEAAASGTGLGAAELGIATLPEVPAAPMPPPRIKPENDPKLGLVFKTPPPAEMRDDLTALKGIAKVLENRLHEFGIYTWEQIATWSPEHVKEFSARLSFKDRIQREDWIGQAQKLHAEKSAAKA
jgi:predicted flap endonuclease-1-like 5' DNA nuclease